MSILFFVQKKRIWGRIGDWQKMVGATGSFLSEIELLLHFAQKRKFFEKSIRAAIRAFLIKRTRNGALNIQSD
jgi:hypothetical protein